MKTVLVTGSSGGLGRQICRQVVSHLQHVHLILGDYNTTRADAFASELGVHVSIQYVNIHDEQSLLQAVQISDLIINTLVSDTSILVEKCIEYGTPLVDVTVNLAQIQRYLSYDEQALALQVPIIIGAGFIPGLSGLLVKHAVSQLDEPHSADLAFLQSANASSGLNGFVDMLGILSSRVVYKGRHGERLYAAVSHKRSFLFPSAHIDRSMWLAHFFERDIVSEKLRLPAINYWTGFDKSALPFLLYVLSRLRVLNVFQDPTKAARWGKLLYSQVKHNPQQPETTSIAAEAHGIVNGQYVRQTYGLTAPSDYAITSLVVVTIVKLLEEREPMGGVVFPFEVFSLEEVMAHLREHGIEFVEHQLKLAQHV
ncbi:saccharopine dehydrogenase family protein [Paenibacillus sp. 481]|uniref:saccharopine dehydrogenase family protein n=1 Tax=Paenibacillus sp. 481 TaxID=2835869 RepID=UPI001E5CDF7D|nr:saccharopine dehydrogenase NADP-binding domain-containing protein [Paenibacillus sp. 481]UHA73681.1 saccharopine dehydrogenase NADP-binding domain-containing protein [Paenibacillus sp. 481]